MKLPQTIIRRTLHRGILVRQATTAPRFRLPTQSRVASTGSGFNPADEVGEKGTAKTYNKDGTDPNKKLIYAALGVLGLGGVYALYGSDKTHAAEKIQKNAPPAR
ncbi:hypothetical protein B0J18DRAFT_276072 [Chaetomium sp. MPI-SDFR-AT-0129]|nr:hypothetical protein B0J18DRAFT_276072 [Chaetomium sp. MPI-SDFR-AT-0129]